MELLFILALLVGANYPGNFCAFYYWTQKRPEKA